jgi:hypothetical protein
LRGKARSTSRPPAGVDVELASPAKKSTGNTTAPGAAAAHAVSTPTATPPATITRRSPSRSAATPAAYDPKIFPNAKEDTARPASAEERPRSALMKPVSSGRPWSTIETPNCATTARASTNQGLATSKRLLTGRASIR